MSHYHLDHLNGIPKFSPLYNPDISLHCRGPELGGHSCEEVFQRMLSSPLWPVPVDSLGGNRFEDLPEGDFTWGDFQIRRCMLNHFEGCVAYRIQQREGGPAAVIATDVEWGGATPEQKKAFLDLCSDPEPPAALIFDGHFAPEDYTNFEGWGHSTWQHALDVAHELNIPQLYITHHAPQHSDDKLTDMESELHIDEPAANFARQGQTIDL